MGGGGTGGGAAGLGGDDGIRVCEVVYILR
jgi:hypothetical protein